ncbi:metallophosphoesterase family protein [Variovorax sp. LT1R16]|uniref:metallophosphoesterase family protein n=1 Tax=Variovorax sp. LT1R16 TaxID=3443728 RepID=UPI003F45B10B
MSTLLQISDPHFGTERAPVVHALEALVREVAPSILVLSGDITQRATRAQFAAARAFVERLNVPAVVAVPGNHDIPLFQLGARLFSPYARYTEAFGTELEPVLSSPDWLVVSVNTTRWYRHKDGEVSAAQIERVAERLARATPSQVRAVVTHQPVMVTRAEDAGNRLHGADAALGRWAAAGADIVMGGHIHLPFVRAIHPAGSGLSQGFWAVQAGTAVSSRVRADKPNSVNLLRPHVGSVPRACTVERWDHSAGEGRFVCAETRELTFEDA